MLPLAFKFKKKIHLDSISTAMPRYWFIPLISIPTLICCLSLMTKGTPTQVDRNYCMPDMAAAWSVDTVVDMFDVPAVEMVGDSRESLPDFLKH